MDNDNAAGGRVSYIAEIAHIIPVSDKGERGDEPRPADINDIGNLLPLCPTCHTMADEPGRGGRRWPPEKMRRLKREHEAWVYFERRRPPDRQASGKAPVGATPAEITEVKPGDPITVAGRTYWIVSDPRTNRVDGMFIGQKSPDGDATLCAAYGYAETGEAGHVWLRRVNARSGSLIGDRWRAELAEEAALLTGRLPVLPGLPRVLAVEVSLTEALVITALPSVTSMRDRFRDKKGTAEEAVRALLRGLGALCEALGALHDEGFAHGALDPATILVGWRGRLALRDLGQATAPGDRGGPAADTRPWPRSCTGS